MKIPTIHDFEKEIELLKKAAKEAGESHIDIRAGTLHEMLGDFKGKDARMATCSRALYNSMKSKDEVIQLPKPISGNSETRGLGSNLIVRYYV